MKLLTFVAVTIALSGFYAGLGLYGATSHVSLAGQVILSSTVFAFWAFSIGLTWNLYRENV